METFQAIVKTFLGEIQAKQASLDSLNRLIKNEHKRVDSYKGKNIPFVSYSHLVMSDITEDHDLEREINYSSGIDSKIEAEHYDLELDRIISTEGGYLIAQTYERLESFLKDSLALHFYHIKAGNMNLHKSLNNLTSYEDFKSGVRNIRSRNNSELFKFLRRTCPLYSQYETSNNVGHNLSTWYGVYSLVRHAIVHQSSVIKYDDLKNMSKFEKEILKHYFPGSFIQKTYQIVIPPEIARKAFKRIAEFGFTIFKALSIHNNKPWKILKK